MDTIHTPEVILRKRNIDKMAGWLRQALRQNVNLTGMDDRCGKTTMSIST